MTEADQIRDRLTEASRNRDGVWRCMEEETRKFQEKHAKRQALAESYTEEILALKKRLSVLES